MKTVLTIAGFDPSSGAGVTADLMVFAAHGLFGTSAITALTVQSTVGVRSVEPVRAEVLRETLACLEEDLPAVGIKIGMLSTAANVHAVSVFLEEVKVRRPGVSVALDPVMRSSSGRELLEAAGVDLLRERLLPLVDWLTPNLAELALLSGRAVRVREDVQGAARALQEMSGERLGVLATGGHLEPPDDLVVEAGAGTSDNVWLRGERVETRATHGTGCALSSAFLSRLVLGHAPVEAAKLAKEYVVGAMRNAEPRGSGRGPMAHLWVIPR